jgi:hypothetical protein
MKPKPSQSTNIYIVEAENGTAKIGSSLDPIRRLQNIRTHSPLLVRLIAVWPGVRRDETMLQARFGDCRSHCEWFLIEGEFAEFVAKKWGKGLEAIEPWESLSYWIDKEAKLSRSKALRSASHKANWTVPGYREERLETLRRYREREAA